MNHLTRVLPVLLLTFLLLASCSSDDPADPGGGEDTTAPTVVSTDPDNGAVDVALGSDVTVTFSEAMDPNTFDANYSTTEGSLPYTWTNDRTLVITLEQLAGLTQVTISFETGLTDEAGNGLAAPFSLSFTMESQIPEFVESVPADGAVDVVRNSSVRFRYSRPMDLLSFESAVTVTTPDAATATLGFDLADGDDDWIVLTFIEDLPASTPVTVTIGTGCSTFDGFSPDESTTFTFTTGVTFDTTAPTLLSIAPADGSTIPASTDELVFTFDEAIDPDSFSPALLSGQFQVIFEAAGAEPVWSGDGTVLTVPLPAPLPAGLPLVARFDGFSDVAGNMQDIVIDYRVDVAGEADALPFVDGSRFVFDIDETMTPAGGVPEQFTYTDYYQVEEQGNGDLRWVTYQSDAYLSWFGYDIYRQTSAGLEETGWYWSEVDQGSMSPGILWAKLPFSVQSWNGASTITTPEGSLSATYDVSVVGREDVAAAFTDGDTEFIWYDCWKVTRSYTLSEGGTEVGSGSGTFWYAPAIGVVRSEMLESEENGETYDTIQELTGATLP